GSTLRALVQQGKLARDEIVVISKVGYVQGDDLERAKERANAGMPFPQMRILDDDSWHCIHPEWLEDQLSRSLARLELETLDVCLLHDPETFLRDAGSSSGQGLNELRDQFYEQLQAAFAKLEAEAARGRIGCYGVSSNTAALPHDRREATDLGRMLQAARAAGGENHRFRVLQVPLNLIETGAFSAASGAASESLLARAAHESVAVLVNRPLDAIAHGQLERLADPPVIDRALMFDFARNQVAALEREFRDTIAPSLRVADGGIDTNELFAWSDHLADFPLKLESFQQWQEAEGLMIRPQVERVVQALDAADLGPVEELWQGFRLRYLPALEDLFTSLRARASELSRVRTQKLHVALDPALPEGERSAALAQKVLHVTSSLPGVTSVLVGARRREYVEDLSMVMQWRKLPSPERALEAVRCVREEPAV
ncbi:MAG TPA: aldo/keto reductase, partial [Polyangiaceae bacterium]|nr:aldo/keto reductase [Polyangiaceae bacterium]